VNDRNGSRNSIAADILSRRVFMRRAAGGAVFGLVGAQLLLEACSAVIPSTPASTTPAAGGAAKPGTGGVPTYVPFKGPEPDLPGTADGVQPAFNSYPRTNPKSVAQTPLNGGEITAFTNTVSAPPSPMEENSAWQEVNRQLGATLKVNIVSSADYAAKLNTLIAGDDLPEMVYVNQGGPNPVANLLAFLQAKMMDLTPYLAGDAVKDYPNLANFAGFLWKGPGTIYNEQIWGVPIPRPAIANALMVHQEMLEQIGAEMPKTADDLKRILVALTRPQANVYGFGMQATSAFNVVGFSMLFGAPNNWGLDKSGKLIKNYVTEEFKAAVGYARDLYQAGVIHPNSPTNTNTAGDADFVAGKFAFYYSTWTGFSTVYWPQALAINPAAKLRPVPPFSADGAAKAQIYLGVGNFGNTYLKRTTQERTRQLLNALNYLAAPFGTQEQLLLSYGLQGSDYNLDDKGNPIPAQGGFAARPVPWRFLTQYPSVLYNTVNSEEFARVTHSGEEAMIAAGVQDPTLSLYSPTFANRNATIQSDFLSAMTDIISGRRQIGELDQAVTAWRSGGGDKMRDEYQQALAAARG
jgi:putative aldouronate transport system substrate-binding protein